MRFRTTIILILLLLGLGAYVYFVEYPKAEQEAKKKTLFEFNPDDATEVALIYPDREIVLKKSAEGWRIAKPMDVPADETSVKNLVTAIAECEVKKELKDTSSDLAQYGLDKPMVTVTVKLKDKDLPGILVGKNTPVGFSTYIQKADDKQIRLTSSAFRSGMDKQVKDLRDKTIVSFEDKDVHKLELHGEAHNLVLAQKDDTWTIEQPATYPADASTVRSFLSTLRSMRAVDFADDQPSDLSTFGLDNPRLTVTLALGKDNAEKRLLYGKETDKKEVYVQGSGRPTVYTVSDWVFRDLNKGLADFRDKTLLAFDREKITAIELRRNDGSQAKLVRGQDKQWRIEGGPEGKPADTVISQFIGDLHDLKGYEIAADHPTDLSQFGLDQPLLRITVVGAESKPLGTVLIGSRTAAEAKKEYTGMAEAGSTVFLVRDYQVTRLDKQPQDFIAKPTPTAGAAPPPAAANGDAMQPDEGAPEEEPVDEETAPGSEQD